MRTLLVAFMYSIVTAFCTRF